MSPNPLPDSELFDVLRYSQKDTDEIDASEYRIVPAGTGAEVVESHRKEYESNQSVVTYLKWVCLLFAAISIGVSRLNISFAFLGLAIVLTINEPRERYSDTVPELVEVHVSAERVESRYPEYDYFDIPDTDSE